MDLNNENKSSVNEITFYYSAANDLANAETYARYYKEFFDIKKDLANLKTTRGDDKFFGFVFEYMHASEKNISNLQTGNGEVVHVINDDGIADFITTDASGKQSFQQAKAGYTGTNKYKITKEKYDGQTIVYDKGNIELEKRVEKIGLQGEESNISKADAKKLTAKMKKETSKLKNANNTAPITAELYGISMQLKAANTVGLKQSSKAAAFTAGLSFGKNMYSYLEGDIEIKEMLFDTSKDVLLAGATSYVTSAGGYLAAGTIGTAIQGTVIQQGAMIVAQSAVGQTIVSVGSITATMSVAAGPLFLLGMALGTGIAVFKGLKSKVGRYNSKIAKASAELDQVISAMKLVYDSLDNDIRDFYSEWDKRISLGFEKIVKSIENDDFYVLSDGLDEILSIFDQNVPFHYADEVRDALEGKFEFVL